jgi:hypothetical protein
MPFAPAALLTISLLAQVAYSELPRLTVVTLETLVAEYRAYDNREIVIAGTVITGLEGSVMILPIPSPPGQTHAMFIEMPLSVARGGGRLEREYLAQEKKGGSITAILRGRFHGAATRTFGHQNCCEFLFEITKVLAVG